MLAAAVVSDTNRKLQGKESMLDVLSRLKGLCQPQRGLREGTTVVAIHDLARLIDSHDQLDKELRAKVAQEQIQKQLGRSCWFKEWVPHPEISGQVCLSDWKLGAFYCWGAEYEEFDTGLGNTTVAIVEDVVSHNCLTVLPRFVNFSKSKPIEVGLKQSHE